MRMTVKISLSLGLLFTCAFTQTNMNAPKNKLIVHADSGKVTISRHIYGQFSEHLGRGIYEGIWVGENSSIPNTRGIRNDVVAALKKIKIPNLRWPGGCFADEYHWRDGIGPTGQRPKMVNTNWGAVTEDNSFGTHEFMDLCEQLGAEPVICGNIGSGTVKEMSDWVQYLTSAGNTPMAELRKKNGRDKPWTVKFWAVGNETWGCGGIMSAAHYADESARYSFFLKNYGGNTLYKIASGGLPEDYNWTETIMKKWSKADGWLQGYMSGYSLHFYTVVDWSKKGSATNFAENEWFATLSKTIHIEELITQHAAVMDKYDPEKRIGLIVDEWGTWFDVEPGANPSFLYQQNTLRDAMVAAVNFNIFHQHCERVKMANIAQTVNVLQAMILTDKEKMILTPTYHVFDLYKVHQDAVFLPSELKTEDYEHNGQKIPALNVSSSKARDGGINISIVNVHPEKNFSLECELRGIQTTRVSGQILTGPKLNSHNTFDQPANAKIADFKGVVLQNNVIKIEMPAKSIVVLNVK